MPPPNLQIIKPGAIIVPVQSKLILFFFAIIQVFVIDGVGGGPGCAAKGVVIGFLRYRTMLVDYHPGVTEVVFEKVLVRWRSGFVKPKLSMRLNLPFRPHPVNLLRG
jgi:hypothetical protein